LGTGDLLIMKRDEKGRIHFKVVLWGPSMGGKTTALRWIYNHSEGLSKGGFTSIEGPDGRTIFFDYAPMSASGRVIFNVFTVAGSPTQRTRRQIVSKDSDGVLFVVDSSRERLSENIESLRELKESYGDRLGKEVPLLIMLNKRDLPNAMGRRELVDALGLEKFQVYETISVLGIGLLQTFKALIRTLISYNLQQGA